MAAITTRAGKGAPLTNAELDTNFENLNSQKLEAGNLKTVAGQAVAGAGDIAISKANVGLGNVDNTSDANKPVSTAAQTALDLKANAASPTLTGSIAANGSVRATANALAALDINCALGNHFTKTIAGNSTLTFSNVPAAGIAYGCVLELTHTSGTLTHPTGTVHVDGSAPSLTTGKVHLLYYWTRNGGTTWRCAVLKNYAS